MPKSHIFAVAANSTARPDKDLQGAKGAGLIEMVQLGLPVPAAFIIGTKIGSLHRTGEGDILEQLMPQISQSVAQLEELSTRKLGASDRPLLLSVRSGATLSMPGMMDTILNLGMNLQATAGLEKETGDARFAWDTYRRFVTNFALVVFDFHSDEYEELLEELRIDCRVDEDMELPAAAQEQATRAFLAYFERDAGRPFPQKAEDQLLLAIGAVFDSWNTQRAKHFRKLNNISNEGGTAAIIQTMVFGNRGENSCTGVYFTRNPSTGEKAPYGEYLPRAQGEDVVAGLQTPLELTEAARIKALSSGQSMEKAMPDVFHQLLEYGEQLECHFSDMQEIEFTVESGVLHMLQTRSGKRNAHAGLRIAVEMVEEGILNKSDAIDRLSQTELASLLVSRTQPTEQMRPFAKGLPASPGAACGKICFTSDDAVNARNQGDAAILVRPETDPRDIAGMDAAKAILTSRGGMTSHAAVVARGMGKPCITAAMSVKIDLDNRTCTSAGHRFNAGDVITLDGASGLAFPGEVPIVVPVPDGPLLKYMSWKEELE